MKKNVCKSLIIIGVIVCFVGLIVLFKASDIGIRLADRAIQANGGSMDTDKYYFIMRSKALSCQLIGAICSLFGGGCAILFGYRSVSSKPMNE